MAHKAAYTYDSMNRISKRVVTNGSATFTSDYTYAPGGYGSSTVNSTSPLISKITQPEIPFEYTYDELGNIVSEKRGNLTTTYHYDSLGQLVQVNDPHENATWVYQYDRGGNIIQKTRHALTDPESVTGPALETITYSYGDSNWKDKLTAFNGQTITYDTIGNPLNDGTWTYAWTAGRQLAQMSKTGMTVQFQYNHGGLRTRKAVTENNIATTADYTWHGTLLTHLKQGGNNLHFFYDAQSRPAMVDFNGTKYTYLHNLQGDICGMLDSAGNLVVEYKYNEWGKPVSVRTLTTAYDTLASLNPFRYRGYIWDEETGRYYLRSRYYNPEWGRFINADVLLGKTGGLRSAQYGEHDRGQAPAQPRPPRNRSRRSG